jgi:hypothetical protein
MGHRFGSGAVHGHEGPDVGHSLDPGRFQAAGGPGQNLVGRSFHSPDDVSYLPPRLSGRCRSDGARGPRPRAIDPIGFDRPAGCLGDPAGERFNGSG